MSEAQKIQRSCQCQDCEHCGGKGYFWELHGQISSMHPMDDLAEEICCENCSGEGIEFFCQSCIDEWEGY